MKSIKNISLLRQQPLPQSSSSQSNKTADSKPSIHITTPSTSSSANLNHLSISNTQQQLSHLAAVVQHQHQLQQQQQQHHQIPPSSPRVHALNGAFHYLSTSSLSPTDRSPSHLTSSPHNIPTTSSVSSSSPSSDFKMEPNVDVDDMPTDLSTGGDRKYNGSGENGDYP